MIGKSIIVIMICFMSMILYFVKTAINTEFNLVSTSYYQDELLVDILNNERKNDLDFAEALAVSQSETGLELKLQFPQSPDSISVLFYSPRHPSEDHSMVIPITGNREVIPLQHLTSGNWRVTLLYTAEGRRCRRELSVSKS